MPTPRVITTPLELAKYVGRILGTQWSLSVDETTATWLGRHGSRKTYEWRFFAWCNDPLTIHVSVGAKSLAGLVKAVDRELWEKIREEFEKQSVKWQVPPDPDLIETAQRRLTRQAPALTHKPAALTHTPAPPAAAPHQKQLLLLPPPPKGPCCNWPGCTVEIGPKAWACREHWALIPHTFQQQIFEKFRPGETPSADYLTFKAGLVEYIKRYPNFFKG